MNRIYVQVNLSMDETGFMKPMSFVWNNRAWPIQEIRSFRAAKTKGTSCYTVMVNGKEMHLFFEKTDPLFSSVTGRWFMDKKV